uniref:Uncharacterized protein n=1 Tax=Siphoviridae sp. ctbrg2 TaxID=2823589 RepID=A0A8S5LG24_9CAUD|nr:MAG TPA: hypothetical protein [Siphoviridae sp. ctbrg2]
MWATSRDGVAITRIKQPGFPRVRKTDLRRGGFDTLMRDVREDNCIFHNNRLR